MHQSKVGNAAIRNDHRNSSTIMTKHLLSLQKHLPIWLPDQTFIKVGLGMLSSFGENKTKSHLQSINAIKIEN